VALVLVSQSRHKEGNPPYLKSPVVDEEKMRPCHWQRLGMWRIPNPNPTESDTFPKSEIRRILKIYYLIMTDSKFLFRSNSTIIFDW